MITLNVWIEGARVGRLSHDTENGRFAFAYDADWLASISSFPLAPALPLEADPQQGPEAHSAAVRRFFDNLLPEGQALDDAAALYQVSKSNSVGLLVAFGRETAGAIRLNMDGVTAADEPPVARLVTDEELSQRIRSRPSEPFSVWDGKVRLSIAGYQDKIAVMRRDGKSFLVEGSTIASTHILKPEPVRQGMLGLTSNEFFCMRLARAAGLPAAQVQLLHVPEPVLCVTRFDRRVEGDAVRRLHVIDGCQALGVDASAKYERPYGGGRDVRDVRDGASLPRMFGVLKGSPSPAAQRLQLLRWVIFQVLIGNTDAHAKNVSFYAGSDGISLTPTYDIVSVLGIRNAALETELAMAIGDSFEPMAIPALEWACMAKDCGLGKRLVSRELRLVIGSVTQSLPKVQAQVMAEGAVPDAVQAVAEFVHSQCECYAEIASEINSVDDMLI